MYDAEDLELTNQADRLLEMAAKNMGKDGYLVPTGVIYKPDGEAMVCGLPFASTSGKQKCFQVFRSIAREKNAIAVAFVSEAWVATRNESTVDLGEVASPSQSLDREEAVVVTVITPDNSVVRMAPILRDGEEFRCLGEVEDGDVIDAEFSRGIWQHTIH
jgi:hypothetical protein